MRSELKYWRDLSKDEKSRLKSEHNIKVVTFQFIKLIYESREQKEESENVNWD